MRINASSTVLVSVGCILVVTNGFQPIIQKCLLHASSSSSTRLPSTVKQESEVLIPNPIRTEEKRYWEIGRTMLRKDETPLSPEFLNALETNTHPAETQDELGNGIFLTRDWRRAWHTYESPADNPDLIDPITGQAEYDIDEIDGQVPDDLVGVLYRNGPGKFGVDNQRVQHVLDADGLVIQINFPKKTTTERKFTFRSRFVQTKAMMEEEEAKRFLYRGTFGTGPWSLVKPEKKGLNEDPFEQPVACKVLSNAFKTDIKNTANTQVIAFGGKVLALFEAGLPHELDPVTLETIGEYDMNGQLSPGKLPVKLGGDIPEQFTPSFIGGAAHTAHPNVCPNTGNLVGWQWSQLVTDKALEVTFTEWSNEGFSMVATSTFKIDNCELAPHDMALTENCILLKVNSLKMDQASFLSGLSGPAASLKMDGRANVFVHVFPRPTSKHQFEPYQVEVPPCFSIHFSHAYEDEDTGNIVSFFSGWPPSDSKDFLGAWGGFAPNFLQFPPTLYWKMIIDPKTKTCLHLGVAPGAVNACAEHFLVHPNFNIRKAKYAYPVISNIIGDSTAPCGYARLLVEEGSENPIPLGERNEDIDAYFFGTRFFAGEPLIVPKEGGDINNEKCAYLLGVVHDCVKDKSAIAIFDLENDIKEGPVAMMWLKSQVPHGLHGCFASDESVTSSVFC